MSTATQYEVSSGLLAHNALSNQAPDADLLVRTHTRLVERIARSIYTRMSAAIPVEDLVQVGLIALIESARVFEARGVAKFSTYAACRIRGAIIDELRHQATISRQALRDRRSFARTNQKLACALGRPPSDADMAQALGIGVAAYRKAAAATSSLRFESIDSTPFDSSGWFTDPTPSAFENLARDRMQMAIMAAMDELPEVEAKVLRLYFIEEMSLDDIGDILGVTGTRVCRIKKKAVEKVRLKLTGWA